MIILSFNFSVFGYEEQKKVENLDVRTKFEGLFKSENEISKDEINFSKNFLNEQVIRYPEVKKFLRDNKIETYEALLTNFKQIMEVIMRAQERWVNEKRVILQNFENHKNTPEFQKQYVEYKMGEIAAKKQLEVGAEEIKKVEEESKNFNGEEFKSYCVREKQRIENEIIKTTTENSVLKEMLGDENLMNKAKERFKKVFEQSNLPIKSFNKDLEKIMNI